MRYGGGELAAVVGVGEGEGEGGGHDAVEPLVSRLSCY